MARVPDEEIERLKKEVSLERLAEARGVVLTRHGADLRGGFLMTGSRVWGLRRRRIFGIVWELARRAGRRSIGRCGRMGFVFAQRRELLKAEPWLAPVNGAKVSRVRKLEAPVDTSVDDARVLEQVVAYYHETLKTSPEALE